MKPAEYLAIVEAAGRAPAAGKKGKLPEQVTSVLEGLRIDANKWIRTVVKTQKLFGTAIGSKVSLALEAARRGMTRVVCALKVFAAS